MSRTGLQRLEAIEPALARAKEFMARLADATGDAMRCADMMAEAIGMARAARGHEPVGRNGKVTFCMEVLKAAHCMDAAREAYDKARGTNSRTGGAAQVGAYGERRPRQERLPHPRYDSDDGKPLPPTLHEHLTRPHGEELN